MLKNLNLKKKLLFGSIFSILVYALTFCLALYIFWVNNSKWTEFETVHLKSIESLYGVHKSIGFDCGVHSFKNYLVRKDDAYYAKSRTCFTRALSYLSEVSKYPPYKVYTEAIELNIYNYLDKLEFLKANFKNDSLSILELDLKVKVDDSEAISALSKLERQILDSALLLRDDINAFSKQAIIYILIIFIFGVFLTIFVGNQLANYMAKGISKLSVSAKQISEGDLDSRVELRSNDELGLLASKLETMRISIRQYLATIEDSNKELEQFAYVASHDLQEPLRKIISFGERLETSGSQKLDENCKNFLNKIIASSVRMRTLIDDLLLYSRVSSTKKEFKAVDLQKVVSAVIDDLEVLISKTNATITFDQLPFVAADPTQMRQLFQNFLSNSLKFRKVDEAPVVHISCDRPNNLIAKISIQDNGIGFDEKYINKIFLPFQRLHSRDEYDGTGIGLAVCSRIVKKHGSQIVAKSKESQGTCFSFELKISQQGVNYEV